MRPAGRGKDLPEQQPEPFGVDPRQRVVGPASSTGPSAEAHCQPDRTTTVARGRARRLATRWASPRLTRPTTCSPVTGCGSTPALTTDDWMVPSGRSVDTTDRP